MQELQNTTIDGEMISGTFSFTVVSMPISQFLNIRSKLREVVKETAMVLGHCEINERALVQEKKVPEKVKEPEPEKITLKKIDPWFPVVTKHRKMHPASREFFKQMVGVDQGTIIKNYRTRFYLTKLTDEQILENYRIANNLR